ncbi:MAG: metal-dependent hydrolase [Pirellulaceae bacterium]|nr:metal-dependent hydrolase [Pirellulaceae bacterium]
MTTPEHTLVGLHVAFALGVHRSYGWAAVTMAGLAANVPDWDGLPMLFDMQRFETGHRVWGHNLIAIFLSSLLLGWTQFRYSWIERIAGWLASKIPSLKMRDQTFDVTGPRVGTVTFFGIALISQLLHLPCDMVVSGGKGLTDWAIQPFWPFSNAGFVYPMIPWGDVGPTVILMAGIIIAAKRPARLATVSMLTLLALSAYLVARAWARGTLIF